MLLYAERLHLGQRACNGVKRYDEQDDEYRSHGLSTVGDNPISFSLPPPREVDMVL